jgi:hypothetical protein
MSVACLRPPQLVSDVPRRPNQAIGCADLHRSLEEALQHRLARGLVISPRQAISCSAELASVNMSCGARSLCPRRLAKPTGVWHAATATDASTTRIFSMATARAMERSDPVERRGAVISDPPLLRQLGHRMQLVLDQAQVTIIDRVSGADASRRQTPRPNPPADSLGVPTQPISSLSDSQHMQDGTPHAGPPGGFRADQRMTIGNSPRPTPVHIDASVIQRAASTYRPLATRTSRPDEVETCEASAPLTEDRGTGLPTSASTAAWMSLARIGSPRSVSTSTTAFRTQPGRRDRCRRLSGCRGGPPLARTAASFPASRRNDPCRSWFE